MDRVRLDSKQAYLCAAGGYFKKTCPFQSRSQRYTKTRELRKTLLDVVRSRINHVRLTEAKRSRGLGEKKQNVNLAPQSDAGCSAAKPGNLSQTGCSANDSTCLPHIHDDTAESVLIISTPHFSAASCNILRESRLASH